MEPVASFTRPTSVRADEAAEVADRVDHGDARGRGAPPSSAAGIVQKTPCAPSRKNRPTASAGIAATGETTVEITNAARRRAGRPTRAACARPCGRSGAGSAPCRTMARRRTGIAVTKPLPTSREPVDLVDDLADPERQAVDVDHHREVQDREGQHAVVREHLAERVVLAAQRPAPRPRGGSPASRRSSSSSQPASCGPSGRRRQTHTPATTAGSASIANSHCRLRPATPRRPT